MPRSNIKLVSVKCPDCGAILSIEENRASAFCTYCGAKVIISNENEYIYRTIDEAEIKKSEDRKEIRLKELELERHERELGDRASKRGFYILLILFFSCVLLGALINLIQHFL